VDPRKNPFGSSVRRRRTAVGMTIAQLAEKSGLSVNWVSEVERGREPSLTSVIALARALDVTPGELVDGGSAKRSQEALEAAKLVEALPQELQAPLLQFLRLSVRRLRKGSRSSA
jgi:transcriptional regulator with XRE-family HTH domain